MEMQRTNLELMEKLLEWDPLGYGIGSYETELVDVLQAAHKYNDSEKLAKEIQAIFEFSFEELIPLTNCEEMAKELLQIIATTSCEL